ncbi:hypothetical protein IHE45_13G061300 [Dioscorea alata]|uniref:Uncharacterized protein n=1 Tax=Dioscorea alata TaxID=55571 RepID=A0ACB7UYI4_DIOAL|nr:hypothetical protein IHE45_13G061300 [Dioscorea alata]
MDDDADDNFDDQADLATFEPTSTASSLAEYSTSDLDLVVGVLAKLRVGSDPTRCSCWYLYSVLGPQCPKRNFQERPEQQAWHRNLP